jgi:hypothetical protein
MQSLDAFNVHISVLTKTGHMNSILIYGFALVPISLAFTVGIDFPRGS